MFSGIIETIGTVSAKSKTGLMVTPKKRLQKVAVGESIAVDGVCLTAHGKRGEKIAFRLLPETSRATTLENLRIGSRVNLERAMRATHRLGGHFLLGHVDGKGKIVARRPQGDSVTLEIEVPRGVAAFLVPKGPLGVDGVSLTLDSEIRDHRVKVHLAPHTLSATTLGDKSVGDRVNLEIDLIAKYLFGV